MTDDLRDIRNNCAGIYRGMNPANYSEVALRHWYAKHMIMWSIFYVTGNQFNALNTVVMYNNFNWGKKQCYQEKAMINSDAYISEAVGVMSGHT